MKNNYTFSIYYQDNTISWNKIKLLLSILFILTVLVSCDNFVDVNLPNTQINSKDVFEDKTTANAAMISVYAKMRDEGIFTGNSFGISHLLGNYTDELDFYGNPQDAAQAFHNNIVLPSNSEIKALWNNSYNQIYGANAVLEGVTNSTNLTQTDRDVLKGEALFTRALIHLYLTNLYGSIPYIKTTDYELNAIAVKETSAAVYFKCIEDLSKAVALLPESYASHDRTRPNKYAARAVLSKVYLYTKQWAEASNEASSIINNTGLYPYENDLSKIFLKQSSTTIWQFAPTMDGQNTREAETFIFTVGPPPLSALSQNLLSAFTIDDKRKENWISSVSEQSETWYYPAKYKSKNSDTSTEYSIILRLNEMYLVRAESRAHAGDLIGSKEDLNVIRNTAGLGNTTAVTQNEILEAILKENQLEFFTEFGHRFFDLKRFDMLDSTLSDIKPNWDSFENVLPLPAFELNLNKNLNPQNAGY